MPHSTHEITPDIRNSLTEALATWDRGEAATRIAEAEDLRLAFIAAFPLESWPTMALDSYALGLDIVGGTVGWWLEFNTRKIASMSGGSSHKHLIFKGADRNWKYPKQYASVEDAWAAVRSGFVDCFRLAAADRIDEIFNITALYGAPALRTKALYMYFPDKFIPVCSSTHVQHFLLRLGQTPDTNWLLGMNTMLMETLRKVPELADFSSQELGYFLYHWADPRSALNAYKISPGELGRLMPDCIQGGFICVGWDEVGDLTTYGSKEEFRKAFEDAFGHGGNASAITRKSNELWTLMTLEPGDKIIANKGTSEILAIGTVNETGYQYRPERAEYRHTVGVDWDLSLAREIAPVGAWRTTTVRRVSESQYREWFGQSSVYQPTSIAVDEIYSDIENALKHRGQVILYGPPGTGKTHFARRAAVWFLDGGTPSQAAAALLSDETGLRAREIELSRAQEAAPRVWFMVANPQHWSWDDLFSSGSVEFSYGRIQRNYPNVRAGDLVVGYESTPTKRIVALARVIGEYDPDRVPVGGLELEPVARVTNGPTYDDLQNDSLLAHSEPMRLRCQGTLFTLTDIEADRVLLRMRDNDPDLMGQAEPRTPRLIRVTFHPSYTYEDFIEGYRPVDGGSGSMQLRLVDGVFKRVCSAATASPKQDFILLIDEINRGNISKIFGEIITLIEKDKRGLTLRLPQSGDDFMVPSNVFIIGTMNTADRSVQVLDAALRRRFRFIELMPDSDALEGAIVGGLSLAPFLDVLNERIRRKVGRERQIGHAVFFQAGKVISTPEEFSDIFLHEILPLVQEYLYDHYPDLVDIFGADVVDPERERITAHLEDPITLCAKLADHFGTKSAE